jgi:hypothetical protein
LDEASSTVKDQNQSTSTAKRTMTDAVWWSDAKIMMQQIKHDDERTLQDDDGRLRLPLLVRREKREKEFRSWSRDTARRVVGTW